MQPKVSVVIPVYNTERYLQACIDGLLDQTLKECEFIFVNDASSDHSLEILRKNEKKYPERIHVIDSPENLRQGGARNLGIRAARGEYIGFSDSDDFITPDMYERLYTSVSENQADAAFAWMCEVATNTVYSEELKKANMNQRPDWVEMASEISGRNLSDEDRMKMIITEMGGTVTWIYRRELLIENDLFFPEKLRYEDNGWAPLVKTYLQKVCFVDMLCYFYRRNMLSTTCRRNSPAVNDRDIVETGMLEDFRRRGLYQRFYPALEYGYIVRRTFMTYGFYMYTYDNPPEKIMWELMKTLKASFPEWRRNRYYREKTTVTERFKDCIKYLFPILYCRVMRRLKGT